VILSVKGEHLVGFTNPFQPLSSVGKWTITKLDSIWCTPKKETGLERQSDLYIGLFGGNHGGIAPTGWGQPRGDCPYRLGATTGELPLQVGGNHGGIAPTGWGQPRGDCPYRLGATTGGGGNHGGWGQPRGDCPYRLGATTGNTARLRMGGAKHLGGKSRVLGDKLSPKCFAPTGYISG